MSRKFYLQLSLCALLTIGTSEALSQPIVTQGENSEVTSVADMISAIPDPSIAIIPMTDNNDRGYVTLPEEVICVPGSHYFYSPGGPEGFTKIPLPEPKANSQIIDCFYRPIDNSYYDFHGGITKQLRDHQCINNSSDWQQYCGSYFDWWGWVGVYLDRVAGLDNTISPPPGSDSLQYYQSVGAISPTGKMKVRASLCSIGLTNPDPSAVRNLRYRVSGLDDYYVEVPLDLSDIVPYSVSGSPYGNAIDMRVIEVELPTSLFECSFIEPVSAALEFSLYMEMYSSTTDEWVEINFSHTLVDWIEVQWEEVAPVVLVHGISQDATYWDTTNFHGFSVTNIGPYKGLSKWIPYGLIDNSISLVNDPNGRGTTINNGAELAEKLLESAEFYGVDRIHLVAHSKGGLDAREYLGNPLNYDPDELIAISLQTLSTPHDGSVLADVRISVTDALDSSVIYEIPASEYLATEWKGMRQPGPGYRDLTTWACRDYRSNLQYLPADCVYSTYGDDADINQNGEIDHCLTLLCNDDELGVAMDLAPDWLGFLELDLFATFAYQKLATTRSWSFGTTVKPQQSGPNEVLYPIIVPDIVRLHVPARNDIMVTESSAWGYGDSVDGVFSQSFSRLAGEGHRSDDWEILVNPALTPVLGNHAEVTSRTVGEYSHVGPTILSADQQYGYLESDE